MARSLLPPAGIAEYTTTSGTGPYALRGALPEYVAARGQIIDRQRVKYRVTDGVKQEVGEGRYDAATNELVRTRIVSPSESPLNWGAGRKFIYIEAIDSSVIDADRIQGRYPGITGVGVDALIAHLIAGDNITITYSADGITISSTASGSGTTGEGLLPLVTGNLPGPDPVADGNGQYIGVPV